MCVCLTPNGKNGHAHGKTERTNELSRNGIRLLMQHYSVVIASICLRLAREFSDAFCTCRPDDVFIFHRLYLSLSIRIFRVSSGASSTEHLLLTSTFSIFCSHSFFASASRVCRDAIIIYASKSATFFHFISYASEIHKHTPASRSNTNCVASPSNPSPSNERKVKVLRHDFHSVLLYGSWLFLVWGFSRRLRCHLVIAESCVYNWVYTWNLMENW